MRQNRQMSQKDLAAKCEIAPCSLCKIETGHHNMTLTTFFKICEGMGIEPKELLTY